MLPFIGIPSPDPTSGGPQPSWDLVQSISGSCWKQLFIPVLKTLFFIFTILVARVYKATAIDWKVTNDKDISISYYWPIAFYKVTRSANGSATPEKQPGSTPWLFTMNDWVNNVSSETLKIKYGWWIKCFNFWLYVSGGTYSPILLTNHQNNFYYLHYLKWLVLYK